jgi:hypothetical protein
MCCRRAAYTGDYLKVGLWTTMEAGNSTAQPLYDKPDFVQLIAWLHHA